MNSTDNLITQSSDFLTHTKRTSSPALYNAQAQAITCFLAFLASKTPLHPTTNTIRDLTPAHLGDFLTYLQQTRSIETEHLYTRVVQQFLTASSLPNTQLRQITNIFTTHLHENRRPRLHTIKPTPLTAITELLASAHSLPQSPDEESNSRLVLQALRNRAILYLLADTGLRPAELIALRRNALQDSSVIIQSTTLLLPKQSCAYVRHYLLVRDKTTPARSSTDPLFARHDKRAGYRLLPISRWTLANILTDLQRTHLSKPTQIALAKSRQTISPISIRHFFIHTTLQATNDLAVTQALARHKTIATTRQYLDKQDTAT